MNCPKCSAELKEGAKFCHVCGFNMVETTANPEPQQQNPNHNWNQQGATVTATNLFTRAINIMIAPKKEWQLVATETPNTSSILLGYVIPLALIPAIFSIIGYGLIGYKVGWGMWSVTVRSWGMGISTGLSSFIASVVGVYIVALIIDTLAPSFKTQKNFGRALQLVAYSFTPMWVIGIFNFYPPLAILVGILGLYGLFIMYVGFDFTMRPPKENIVGYYLATLGITIVTYFILALILGLIFTAIFVTTTAVGLGM